jgi:hypothetical protein
LQTAARSDAGQDLSSRSGAFVIEDVRELGQRVLQYEADHRQRERPQDVRVFEVHEVVQVGMKELRPDDVLDARSEGDVRRITATGYEFGHGRHGRLAVRGIPVVALKAFARKAARAARHRGLRAFLDFDETYFCAFKFSSTVETAFPSASESFKRSRF